MSDFLVAILRSKHFTAIAVVITFLAMILIFALARIEYVVDAFIIILGFVTGAAAILMNRQSGTPASGYAFLVYMVTLAGAVGYLLCFISSLGQYKLPLFDLDMEKARFVVTLVYACCGIMASLIQAKFDPSKVGKSASTPHGN